jgi:hypothetical protein
MNNINSPLYGFDQVSFKIAPGYRSKIRQAAANLGVSEGEFLRGVFYLRDNVRDVSANLPEAMQATPLGQAIMFNPLAVRLPGPEQVGIIGENGSVIGTLADLAGGKVQIDSPADNTSGSAATRTQPITADWRDCERTADGRGFTGRLLSSRRIRQPGRRRSVKTQRAREAFSDLTGEA